MKVIQIINDQKIAIKTFQGACFMAVSQIVYIVAEDNYSKIVLLNQPAVLVSKTLKLFESQLQFSGFIRCHKSYLVNIAFVNELCCNGISKLNLSNDKEIPVSRTGLKRLKEVMDF